MFSHVVKVYKNCGLKPAIKAALHDVRAGKIRRGQRLYYMRSLFSEEQRENTVLSGYRIIKVDSVKLHMDMVCELEKAVEEKRPALIYMDELRNGELLYKPDFAPDNLCAHNYIGNCIVVREDLIDERAEVLAKSTSLWEFNKYICEKCRVDEIAHISRALFEDNWEILENETSNSDDKILEMDCHKWENSYSNSFEQKNTTTKDVQNERGKEIAGNNGIHSDGGMENAVEVHTPLVSVIIPNYEHVEDLRRCVESLLYIDSYKNIEIIIVENNSKSEEIFSYYDELSREHSDIVRVVKWEGKFNYSAINNYGVGFAKGELILLLNNDTKLIEPESIGSMVKYAQRQNTGAVGACLIYEDKTIQHAGVIVGIGPDRTAVHPNSGVPLIEEGYRHSIHHVQNYSAVTGACLMVKKELYKKLHGLDEEFAVAYNDVDFCLRLRQMGLLNVYVPQALFFHYESKSRGYDDKGERHERFLHESAMFRGRWQHIIDDGDPYYNVNLSKNVPWKIDT